MQDWVCKTAFWHLMTLYLSGLDICLPWTVSNKLGSNQKEQTVDNLLGNFLLENKRGKNVVKIKNDYRRIILLETNRK